MREFSLNLKGRLVNFDSPVVMAIINATPDSFYTGSRVRDTAGIRLAAVSAVNEGADIIDIGAYSTRPGAAEVDEDEELRRLEMAVVTVREVAPEIPLSVDTFRSAVARRCITDFGADIINDVSGGNLDDKMFETISQLAVPYILTHMRGTPATMQSLCDYPRGVTVEVIADLAEKLRQLSLMGVCDVIVDPGFGLAKTLDDNYTLLRNLQSFAMLGRPVLAGLSRKSMFTRLFGLKSDSREALEATIAADMVALINGASILRVHDVAAARRTVDIYLRAT